MKVSKEMFDCWNKDVQAWLEEVQVDVNDITIPVVAWNIAHHLHIVKEAYDIGLNDKHIETALKRIFPKAWSNKENKESLEK